MNNYLYVHKGKDNYQFFNNKVVFYVNTPFYTSNNDPVLRFIARSLNVKIDHIIHQLNLIHDK